MSDPDTANLAWLDELHRAWRADPESATPELREWFEGLDNGAPASAEDARAAEPTSAPEGDGAGRSRGTERSRGGASGGGRAASGGAGGRDRADESADLPASDREALERFHRVSWLVRAYRVRGHRAAQVDPLGIAPTEVPELDPAFHGLDDDDLEAKLPGRMVHAEGEVTVREIVERVRETYTRSIGVQYMHIDELDVRRWLEQRMESSRNHIELQRDTQLRILRRLTDAVVFEEFIQRKYIAAKSFSLEGCETLIPLLDLAIEAAAEDGVEEIVLGMAHRGRLNVLKNIVGKSARKLFREFEDSDPELYRGSGDVKYHLGHSADWTCASGKQVHLSLCFNPSHLEYVNPVALGRLRAKQDRAGDFEHRRGMCLLIHGDASFAGEGVVQETLNMSELDAYSTGGTLHVIVNNQLGYTTPPVEGRSTPHATDVAKMLQIPIFHVNGEDPEAVATVVALALDFRSRFQRDVVIDMLGYRRHGHNEADEPAFTQPLMYRAIEERASVRDSYLAKLLELEGLGEDEADTIAEESYEHLKDELAVARSARYRAEPEDVERPWAGYTGGSAEHADEPPTAVGKSRLAELLDAQTRFPDDFHPHEKIRRASERRQQMAQGDKPLDWSAGEALAFASLAVEGVPVRLTGQDSARGTFSQRHAALHDVQDGHVYIPLQNLSADQARVEIYNSPLSEAGVLGFEYGYSLDAPERLVLWEAQFGDFVNAAQVIVDQFLVSGEDKWRRLSGLVLLLPHGFDGQGPEHSSARLERFLALAAEDNIQVMNLTTPGQYFHALRRQALRRWRKPLVIMTPKSLLRDPRATSGLDELASGRFRPVLGDERLGKARRVLLCSGQVAYDLIDRRDDLGRDDVAVVRLEQLYPLPEHALRAALARCPDGTRVSWVQEEPENMGAWPFLRLRSGTRLLGRLPLSGVCRPPSASPATGSKAAHGLEQEELVHRAFAGA